jgi:hypothetical protein
MQKLPGVPLITTVSPEETLRLALAISLAHFPGQSTEFISTVFQQVQNAFAGTYPGYQRCDTASHDFAHTCQATVATARILDGHLKSGQPPALTARDFELGVAAILLHDIGFLKETGDDSGTGAKYTHVHVERGAKFAEKFLPRLGVTPDEVRIVQLAIRSTAMNVDMSKLPFRNERERFIGCALGTGDIFGWMAAPDYPERLPQLYREFTEAATPPPGHEDEIPSYRSAEDLLRRSREFYHGYVQQMLDQQWQGAYKALEHHFPDDRNHYLPAIEANLDRIDRLLASPGKK